MATKRNRETVHLGGIAAMIPVVVESPLPAENVSAQALESEPEPAPMFVPSFDDRKKAKRK